MKTQPFILNTIIFTCYILLHSNQLFSKEVDQTIAKNVALNIYAERAENPKSNIGISQIIEQKEKGETVFYVLKYTDNGFAIISANDIVTPILAYSAASNFDPDNIPPGAQWMLNKYKRQIEYAINNQLSPTEKTIMEWEKYSSNPQDFTKDPIESVPPLITTTWGQGLYYNELCPTTSSNPPSGHVPAGCGAIAMAQVINYWHHAWKGDGDHQYNAPGYGSQYADFENTLYKYDNMPTSLTSYNQDIATLIYHCAVGCEMGFGPDGSNTTVGKIEDAMRDYFYFDNGIDVQLKSSNLATWDDILQYQLNHFRPIIYQGYDPGEIAGHIWVCDGYQGTDHYHMNWGWYGNFDGYFYTNNLNPDDYNFGGSEAIVRRIKPEIHGLSGTLSAAGGPYYFKRDRVVYESETLTIEPGTEVYFKGRYKLLVYGQLIAEGTETDSIHFSTDEPEVGWHGIRFYNTNNSPADSSRLKYCHFEQGMSFANDTPFPENAYGGSVMCKNSGNVVISNCLFTNNKSQYDGGSIYCEEFSGILIKECEFRNNESPTKGGAIACDTSNIQLKNIEIRNCEAVEGAGVYAHISDIEIDNCLFHHNTAGQGGALKTYLSESNIINTEFYENSAEYGGAIDLYYSTSIMDSVFIYENTSNQAGGIMITDSEVEMNNCMVYENTATIKSGGIQGDNGSTILIDKMINYSNVGVNGGGMGFWDSEVNITQSIFYANIVSGNGYGMYLDNCQADISGTIIWGTSTDQVYSNTGNHSITYSVINGGFEGEGNLDSNPLFENAYSRNFHLSWDSYPFPDDEKSPCIDSGDPLADLDPDGTRADIGIFPFEQNYTSIPAGDISGILTCAESPYYIHGDLAVPLGSELIIEPCVSVVFREPFQFIVNGRLLAEGTETDQISFFATDTIVGWKGIRFNNQDTNGQDSSIMKHCRVMFGNTGTYGNGGGITLSASSEVRIENCLIAKNQTYNNGGGIYGSSSHALLKNNTIINNSALQGGGIFGYSCKFKLVGGTIANNSAESGGGIYFYGNDPELYGVTIRNNFASEFGGAICFYGNVNAVFGSINRCNIYDNYAVLAGTDLYGKDLYSSVNIDLYVDTLTVLNADNHFIYPESKFTKNILAGKHPQYATDLFVSQSGDDSNTGTTASDPLKTISKALLTIDPVSAMDDTLTIHLESGYYSNFYTGEEFPLNWRSNVNLSGAHYLASRLDGDTVNNFFRFYDDHNCLLSNIGMQNGFAKYGGAMYLDNYATPHFHEIKITDCESEFEGGGVYSCENASPTFTNSEFSYNSGRNGGGLSCYSSNATLENVKFYSNSGYNAGAFYAAHNDKIIVEQCIFKYNEGSLCGGAANFYRSDTVIINNSIFENNEASSQSGGALYLQESDVTLNNCLLDGNEAAWGGGAIGFYHSVNLNLNNVSVSNGTADYGGGIYGQLWSAMSLRNVELIGNNAIIGSSYKGEGGAIYLWDVETEIINTTITKNTSMENGGAVYNKSGDISITNSILWQNSPNEIFLESGTTTADYSNIEGGYAGIGNLNVYPEFYDTLVADYSLKSISPCIDMGTPDTTGLFLPDKCLGNNPRIGNGRIDMGAYENFERMELELSIFLEGPFNGTDMNTNLSNLDYLPLSQPYGNPPWNYFGSESVASIPDTDIVDWMLIELHDASDVSSVSPTTIIGRYAAFLKSDGSIVGLDGTSNQLFSNSVTQQLFVVLKHRNHLGILSSSSLTESGEIYSYDFTTPSGQAYGTDAQKDLGGGIYGMFAGDADANGIIELPDKTFNWHNESGLQGYKNEDFNLDGQVNNKDKNDYWQINMNDSSQIPD